MGGTADAVVVFGGSGIDGLLRLLVGSSGTGSAEVATGPATGGKSNSGGFWVADGDWAF